MSNASHPQGTTERMANFRLAYQEVCTSYHAIDDFRAKLLGFLPLATGGGAIALVVNRNAVPNLVTPVALFVIAVTLGLAIYEARGAQRCVWLMKLGKELEGRLQLDEKTGQFSGEPAPPFGLVRRGIASVVVYLAVLAGWLTIALVL